MHDAAAFFDMDLTIIWENTGRSSVRFAHSLGLVSNSDIIVSALKMFLYRLTLLNIEKWYENSAHKLTGLSIREMQDFSSQWFETMVKNTIYKEAAQLIDDHQSIGHRVVIVSNALDFIVQPVAKTLGIADIICTKLETRDGILTGKLIKPLCYGTGKRDYTIAWAEDNNIDLKQSYFYTDSHFDHHLLEVVGFPVATNPDIQLKRTARKNNWPIIYFKKIPAF